jgi:hypothetical protein
MKRAFEEFMYGLTMRGDWITRIVAPLWFRWYCPHPLRADMTARACVEAGDCGCNNQPLRIPQHH